MPKTTEKFFVDIELDCQRNVKNLVWIRYVFVMTPTPATMWNIIRVYSGMLLPFALLHLISLYVSPFILPGGRGGKFSEPLKRRKSGSVSKILFLFRSDF